MRILLVSYEYPPVGAGAATAGSAIAKALTELGHRTIVLTGRFKGLPPRYEDQGIIIHRIPSLRRRMDRSHVIEMASFLAAGLMFVPTIVRTHQVDGAIVFFSMPCGPIGLVGQWICGVPYIISLRGGDVPGAEPSLNFLHRFLSPIRRTILKNGIAIVANSDGLRKMAETADPFAVQVIPNGVDTGFFIPAQSKPARNESVLRILFVGRFRHQKNLPFLFRQAAQLPATTFELHLVGDGPEKQQLEELARKLGIASAITWHGWLPPAALLKMYQSADCLVNPSLYEGMPNVVLEAMACGLPVIASRVPGNDELVREGETGFLFDLQEPDSLMNAFGQLMNNRGLCARLGANARNRVTKNFSWSNVAQAYLALFPRNSVPSSSADPSSGLS
jgi:glycosyltransferase involved in cell wall biosynthesis